MYQVPKSFDVEGGPVKMYLKPERIQQLLARLPGWVLRRDALVRVRLFTTPESAATFAHNACWLACKQNQPVSVSIAGKQVTGTLPGHPVRGCVGGLKTTVFNLAGLIG